jgi:hypothetical protein
MVCLKSGACDCSRSLLWLSFAARGRGYCSAVPECCHCVGYFVLELFARAGGVVHGPDDMLPSLDGAASAERHATISTVVSVGPFGWQHLRW